jgi:gamma-glutamyltranspeptidase / glutathione hydrolase
MLRRIVLLPLAVAVVSAQNPSTMFPPVRGMHEMIGAANNLEVEAGFRMLAQGGNAVDAGVAAALTATVIEQSRVGLGGEIPIIIKMAGQAPVVISGIGVAPAKATASLYRERKEEAWEAQGHAAPIPALGVRAAITPGLVDGLLVALEKYGTLSFEQVVAPAIEHTGGFPIGEEFADFLLQLRRIFPFWPA